MGNIKHNDELLRVHDDGFDVVFNCDNKHQNGVSYHAEKNGKKTKIDPEYAMATLVKKVSGAGWPADLSAPSEGGYGWTESGEQTVVVDNESVATVLDEFTLNPVGYFVTPFNIVDGTYTVIFNGTEYNLNSAFFEEFGFWYLGDVSESDASPDFSRYPFMIDNYGEEIELLTESPGDYEVTIKMEPKTIHKIDTKYLPEVPISEANDLHITCIGDRKVLTPFGAGYVPYKIHGESFIVEVEIDGETTYDFSDSILIPGEVYEVSVNGGINTYVCQIVDDYCYIGTPRIKMDLDPSIGDWQLISYYNSEGIYCNVCGHEGDIFEFEFTGVVADREPIPQEWLSLPEIPAVKQDIYFILDFENDIYELDRELTGDYASNNFNGWCKYYLNDGITDRQDYKGFIQNYNIYGIVTARETNTNASAIIPLSCNFQKRLSNSVVFCGAVPICADSALRVEHVAFSYEPWLERIISQTLHMNAQ